MIGTLVGISLPLWSMELIKESLEPADGQIPKFYFHFWAFHLVMFGSVAYTVSAGLLSSYAVDFVFAVVHVICGLILLSLIMCLGCANEKNFNTPTRSFNGDRAHRTVMVISMFLLLYFPYVLVNTSPSFFLSLYRYPLQTLVWCAFAFTATLYVNALLALLLFQCERCCLTSLGQNKARLGREKGRLESHIKYYSRYYQSDAYMKRPRLTYTLYIVQPIGTALLVAISTAFCVFAISPSIYNHETLLEQCLVLVPTLTLLCGYWYNLEMCWDVKRRS